MGGIGTFRTVKSSDKWLRYLVSALQLGYEKLNVKVSL